MADGPRCHAIGCTTPVEPRLLMCGHHWRLVPRTIQIEVLDAYKSGQERRKDPARDYLKAARRAIDAVWEKEAGHG